MTTQSPLLKLFREYDIRGIADTELTSSFAWALGRSVADFLKSQSQNKVYIGQDVRLSSPRLANSFSQGLSAGDIQVRHVNAGPTPLLYFAVYNPENDFPTKSGIMITGSHNPAEFNGFKMVVDGKAIYGKDILSLFEPTLKYLSQAPSHIETKVFTQSDYIQKYIDFSKSNLRIKNPSQIKVVLDAGNGAAGPLAVETFQALGLEVVPLYCDFDGRFPNHHPDPTIPKNLVALQNKIAETKATLGIAFDGDGDRIGVVSSTGQILFGDQILIYLAKDLLKEAPGATIISEVKSSQVLYDELSRMGAKPIVWKTGHSLIKAKLKETGAELAGEMSGHIFFKNRFFGYDDAIYAGARFIEALSKDSENIDTFLEKLPKVYNTPELRCDCPDEEKFALVTAFLKIANEQFSKENVLDIDGARIKIPGKGWGLLRASNTQPVIVMRFEGNSPENLKFIHESFDKILSSLSPRVEIPAY